MGRPKADGIGEHPGSPAAETQVRVCARTGGVWLGNLEASLPVGCQEKERISTSLKAWGSAKQTGNKVPPYAHQELEEGRECVPETGFLSTAVSLVLGAASAYENCYVFNRSGIGPRNLNFNKRPRDF